YCSRVIRELAGVLRLIISQHSAVSTQPKTITAKGAKDAKGKKIDRRVRGERRENKGLFDQIQTGLFFGTVLVLI
ncbi:MAG TPA: hypothetical protein VNB54_08965, partial [Alphaproteobacteria bacterium]|nr:hypothetical protein [Alphaproteobacteria bacterium]